MPFKSQKQRAWMYENKPAMAKRWEKETPKGRSLPIKVKSKMKTLSGKNVASKKMPKQVTNKSPDQFVYKAKKSKVSKGNKKGLAMLTKAMKKFQ